MPNWCENRLYIQAPESDIMNLLAAIKADKLLEYMCPQPNLPDSTATSIPPWYNWRVDNWGTKWDVKVEIIGESSDHLMLSFDSAWAPPIAALQYWESQDSENRNFNLRYIEWGMAFCGEEDSEGTSYNIIIPTTVKDVIELIPSELIEEFGIADCVAQWESSY